MVEPVFGCPLLVVAIAIVVGRLVVVGVSSFRQSVTRPPPLVRRVRRVMCVMKDRRRPKQRGKDNTDPLNMLICTTIISFALLLFPVAGAQQDAEECYKTCQGVVFDGLAPFSSEEVAQCLQRPVEDGGHGNLAQDALIQTYSNVLELGYRPGNEAIALDETAANDLILRGLNAAGSGANLPNSEGVYYCITDNVTSFSESFFWVINAGVLAVGLSGNEGLAGDLTEAESAMGGSQGYVVDDALTGERGGVFVRYVFNETHALKTEVQPIEGATGFSCSGRPWYQNAALCEDPARLLCPSTFQGTEGMGTFQVHGSSQEAGIGVSQDIPSWQLCECLDDLECNADTSGGMSLLGVARLWNGLLFMVLSLPPLLFTSLLH